jgi:hypothetical protein
MPAALIVIVDPDTVIPLLVPLPTPKFKLLTVNAELAFADVALLRFALKNTLVVPVTTPVFAVELVPSESKLPAVFMSPPSPLK